MTNEGALRSFWAELWAGARFWSVDNIDGVPPPGRLQVSALCAACPRCFWEQEHVAGCYIICGGCGLTLSTTYRVVVFPLPKKPDLTESYLRRVGLAAGNLLGVHPVRLSEETTVIDVANWHEFIDKRKAWGNVA